MKYIRTKDGVYEIVKIVAKMGAKVICKGGYETIYDSMHIKKQSDNLQTLCDEWVITDDNIHFMLPVQEISFYDVMNSYKDYEIYGAIWTKQGLKYVAKANNQGRLEILW